MEVIVKQTILTLAMTNMKNYHENDDKIQSSEINEKIISIVSWRTIQTTYSHIIHPHSSLIPHTSYLILINFQFDIGIFLVPIDEICL